MKISEVKQLQGRSNVFGIIAAVVGVVFLWAGFDITFSLAAEYQDITFGSLMLAAPLFIVGLLGLGIFWFTQTLRGTNAVLLAILEKLDGEEQGSGVATEAAKTILDGEPGRMVDGAYVCYAHNKKWCKPCRDLD